MERVTMKTPNGYVLLDPIDICDNDYSKTNYKKLVNKIGYYEDLAEQGKLIELPFAIGEPIYKVCYFHSIKDGFIHEEVMSVEFYAANKNYFMAGKVYRTKEEAEQALKQMKAGEKNE